ncbi:hypothetical protein KY366_07620 [Candidatus Woesearchaeota archaeon]|nr:hypothetical protein [Candidatus Woesearchaeota archaeon]
MAGEIPFYEYDLKKGSLKAYSLNDRIDQTNLERIVSSRDGKHEPLSLMEIEKDIIIVRELNSLGELEIKVSPEPSHVPKEFQPSRRLLENQKKRKMLIDAYRLKTNNPDALQDLYNIFNGSVMVVKDGNVKIPLEVCKGGFFDFKATELISVPSLLLPKIYPEGKTIGNLLPEYQLSINQLARYLGFAFILLPSDGAEISFVHRAKGMGIATDCMALSGATPFWRDMESVLKNTLKEHKFYSALHDLIPEKLSNSFMRKAFGKEGPFPYGFYDPYFDFEKYFISIIQKEIEEEYKLGPNEFRIGKCYLVDDKTSVPFIAIEIITKLSTYEIAQGCFNDPEVNKEHPILYSINKKAVPDLTKRFLLLPSSAYVLNKVAANR